MGRARLFAMKRIALCGALITLGVCLAMSGVAVAGDSADALDARPSSSPETSEIVVTATRQSEPLSKAPLSVAAFSGASLERMNVRAPADLVRSIPGTHFNVVDNSISIRGVESDAGAATTAVYIDDTPIQIRAIGTYPTNPEPVVFDLERVELIRGPQGALFGAGAEGGAIRFITPEPEFNESRIRSASRVEATRSGGPSFETGGVINAPLATDRLALRASAWVRHEGGWVDRVDWHDGRVIDPFANRTDTAVARLALRWAASDRLTITPSLNLQRRTANDTASWWEGRSDPSSHSFINGNPVRLSEDDRFVLAAIKVDYDAGAVRVISNTSWFGRRQEGFYDASIYNLSWLQHFVHPPLIRSRRLALPIASYYAPGAITNLQGDFAQEIRLHSADPAAALTWTAGVFFGLNRQENREAEIDPDFEALNIALFGEDGQALYGYGLLPNGASYYGVNIAHDRQIAGFGQADWKATDRLTLSAGLRVAATRFDFTNSQDGPYNAPGPSAASGAQSETPVTPKFGLSYQVDEATMVYATVAKGYRIGGANAPLPLAFCGTELAELGLQGSPLTYSSDAVWSYEAGAKLRGLGGRLKLDASLYYLRWNSIQQNVYLPDCGFTFTANLGQATSKGFDLDAGLRLDEHWSATLALGYVSARYTTDSGVSTDPAAPVVVRAGDSLGGSPWQVAAGVTYEDEVLGRPVFARVDYQYASRESDGPTQDTATRQYDAAIPVGPAYGFLQLKAGVTVGDWRLSAYVDNALDAHPELDRSHEDQQTRLFIGTTLRPRTIGLSTEMAF
jgi:outer membrane receptor protein involved in Fe transport